jgi:lipoprotein-anchoring transpeptidase ErfK/SrfK
LVLLIAAPAAIASPGPASVSDNVGVRAKAPASDRATASDRASASNRVTASAPAATRVQVRRHSTAARILIRTGARVRPGFDRRVETVLRTRSAWSGGPQQLLVLDRRIADGVPWLKLRLASRPNRSAAWVPASRTRLIRNPWLVRVSVDERRVVLYRGGRRKASFRAVVGEPSTPTPRGLFAIYEKVRQPDPDGFLGPFALHLTAHSRVLDNYGGGPGRVAIHGRGGASLFDPLGSAASHGCIRVGSGRVTAMARQLPLGTPVLVR